MLVCRNPDPSTATVVWKDSGNDIIGFDIRGTKPLVCSEKLDSFLCCGQVYAENQRFVKQILATLMHVGGQKLHYHVDRPVQLTMNS